MKILLSACCLILFVIGIQGQTNTILLEEFASSTFPPEGWTIIDHDGDGQNWYLRTDSETGNMLASSKSWDGDALTPHNLLVSQQIDLSEFNEEHRLRVSYKIGATGNNYFNEHYKLVISLEGNSYSDFETGTVLHEETLGQSQSGWNMGTRIVDVENYAGEKFWLAWVHYNCSDEDGLLLDDIHIYEGQDSEVDPPYTSWLEGSAEDFETSDHSFGIVLAGGGGDNNDAMKWFLNRSGGGDVVVIRATGSDGYNDYLYSTLGVDVNSVETLLLNSLDAAMDPYVAQQIRNAEALFIAGGDQFDYYQYWKDTPVMEAINYLINEKRVPVGGTSAGMAILGKVYYTPPGSSAQSSTVLQNPYHSSMNIIGRDDFIDNPVLENTITDTHFDQRDRDGRLFTFLARMITDWGIEAKGIAANEYTAVCIDEDGKAYVFGNPSYDDYAYFLKSQSCVPEVCQSGQPLTWNCEQKAVKVYRILGQKTNPGYFDLSTWTTGEGGTWHYWYAQGGALYKSDATSIDINKPKGLNIFPNPTVSVSWIDLEKDVNNSTLNIYNSIGQTVRSQKNVHSEAQRIVIDLSDLPSGIYFIKLSLPGATQGAILVKE